jgi:fibro-slime domain-containing protein
MNNLFTRHSLRHSRFSRVFFGWLMVLSFVLQTSAFVPLVAEANVVVNVSHTDGTVSTYDLEDTPDNITVSYAMGASSASGTPTLSALADLLGGLNSALVEVKAETSCTGSGTATASASVTAPVTIDGETVVATATANSSVECTGGNTPPPGPVIPAPLSCSQIQGQSGWYARYYNYPSAHPDMELANAGSDDISRGAPLSLSWTEDWYTSAYYRFDRIDPNLNFGYMYFPFDNAKEETATGSDGALHDFHFGTHWSGVAHVQNAGDYTVTLSSDDDAWVYVDGALVIDNAGLHGPSAKNAALHLTGSNRIDIFWAERHTNESAFSFRLNNAPVTMTAFRSDCEVVVNQRPVITLVGADTMTIAYGSIFSDPGATAQDPEDGNITANIATTSTVNTAIPGTYTVTYTVSDSQGLAAIPVVRTVTVMQAPPTNQPPVITLIGDNPMSLTVGSSFVDPGAIATDAEDCVGLTQSACNTTLHLTATGVVNTGVIGAYSVTYSAIDSKGSVAIPVTRTVNVVAPEFCREASDIVLVIDRSGSMSNDSNESLPQQPMTQAKDAAKNFIDKLSLTEDRVSVVSFSTTATLDVSLTSNFANAKSVISGLTADGWTNLPDAILLASNELTANGRPNVRHIIIILSDGNPELSNENPALNQELVVRSIQNANSAKVKGYVIYTIGLGLNVAPSLMQELASGLDHYFFAATGADLSRVYEAILTAECLRDPAIIGGHVYNDTDGNGALTQGEIGLSNWTITLDPANPSQVTRAITTDQSGAYTLADVYDGEYLLCAMGHSGWTQTGPTGNNGCHTITVVGGEVFSGKDFFFKEIVIPPPANQPPVITLIGANPLVVHIGSLFTDPGATAQDPEDGNITANIATSGVVNMNTVGNYTITYTVSDSKGLAATPVTRTVTVVSACSDGLDNDGDGTIDLADGGCTDANDDSENEKPVITLLGSVVMQLVVGSPFADPGANATDSEDCVGLTQEACNTILKLTATGTVNTTLLGTYLITYNATDTQGLIADPKTRTVNVVPSTPVIPGCTANCGGESNTRPVITVVGNNPLTVNQNTTYVDPGATAWDSEDGDITRNIVTTGSVDMSRIGTYTISYNVSDSKGLPAQEQRRTVNVVACTANCGGGGGGGGSVTLSIYNEKLTVTGTTTVVVSWNTNMSADSRVVYGLNHVGTLGSSPYYGYPLTTATDTIQTTSHAMTIHGIPSALATYFRPVSSNGNQTVTGIELTRVPDVVVGGSCEYLKEYLRIGYNNNSTEVLKLQLFLRNFEGFTNVPTHGFFDLETDRSVRVFQDRYSTDILAPWDLPGNTGYVYYTTKKKINEIYCQREFPLNPTQLAEIASFRDLIKRMGVPAPTVNDVVITTGSGSSAVVTIPVVGVRNDASREGAIAGAATVSSVPGASTTEAGDRGGIALADLLATSPAGRELDAATRTAYDIGTVTTTGPREDGVVKQNYMQAAVGAIADTTDISEKTVVLLLFLLLVALVIALVFAVRFIRRRNANDEPIIVR